MTNVRKVASGFFAAGCAATFVAAAQATIGPVAAHADPAGHQVTYTVSSPNNLTATVSYVSSDPPSQAAWMEASGVDGWAAFKVANTVTSFHGYGLGSYSYFNQGVNIYAANAFEVPSTLPAGSLHDLLTIFLSTAGYGGILNVINGTGGSSTSANPDTAVTVTSYP